MGESEKGLPLAATNNSLYLINSHCIINSLILNGSGAGGVGVDDAAGLLRGISAADKSGGD